MTELDKLGEEVEQKIRKAFPLEPRFSGELVRGYAPWISANLQAIFEGKVWDKVGDTYPSIIYCMSDIDYLREITADAYFYYLPAFLIATLAEPNKFVYIRSVGEEILGFRGSFTQAQLEALIAFWEFHALLERQNHPDIPLFANIGDLENIEDIQLKLMIYLDEMKSSKK